MSRPRGFINWQPRSETLVLVNNVMAVLQEYREYLPMTIRQTFYRLVAQYDYEKTERAYKRLCETIGKARRAQIIPMSAIRDDGFYRSSMMEVADLHHGRDVLRDLANTLRLHRQGGQDEHLVIWCEAKGMVPMLESAADQYGIRVASSGGFDSLTAQHEMGRYLAENNGHVLHLGDFDQSGEHVYLSLRENLEQFANGYGGKARLTRIAVLEEQVAEYSLPTAPPKATDNRSFSGAATTQLEAFAPDDLINFVREEIVSRMNMDVYHQVLDNEEEMRTTLKGNLA
jgi:hypothetical protein